MNSFPLGPLFLYCILLINTLVFLNPLPASSLQGVERLKLKYTDFDIPVVYNADVQRWITFFTTNASNKASLLRYLQRAGRYVPVMSKILAEQGLPRDLVFLAMAESGLSNMAISKALAVGPWQFMAPTAQMYGLRIDPFVDARRDPIKSTIAAGRHLKKLYTYFGSWELAMVAYNAGEGKIGKAISLHKSKDLWTMMEGQYLKEETKNYFPKISALAIIGKNLQSFGLEEVKFDDLLDFDEINVLSETDLSLVAEKLHLNVTEVIRLNPELLLWFTPPNESYPLRVPKGYGTLFKSCCALLESESLKVRKDSFQTVRSPKVQSVQDLASQFGVSPSLLAQINGKKPQTVLSANEEIVLPARRGQSLLSPVKPLSLPRHSSPLTLRALPDSLGSGYHVGPKDTLVGISQKLGIPLDKLIKSNYDLLKNRTIREGDLLNIPLLFEFSPKGNSN